jgi:gamma-glutamylcyclotransferase
MRGIYYLAYGSNLHPLRLAERAPSARLIGVTELSGCLLAFHKRSLDGSGKCLLYTGYVDSTTAYGALYELSIRDKAALDEAEGRGKGYTGEGVRCCVNGGTFDAYTYLANPSHIDSSLVPYDWYKGLVGAGARYHGFPAAYVDAIETLPSRRDPDSRRAQANAVLLRKMKPQHAGYRS